MAHLFWAMILIVVSTSISGCTKSPIADDASSNESSQGATAEAWTADGLLVAEDGHPVGDAVIAKTWSANGKLWDKNGKTPQDMDDDEIADFWSNEGVMEPYPNHRGGGEVLPSGKFTIENRYKHRCVVMALNDARTHGGIGTKTPESSTPIKIVMQPLTRIFGKIRCAGKVPEWTNVYVYYPCGIKEAPD